MNSAMQELCDILSTPTLAAMIAEYKAAKPPKSHNVAVFFQLCEQYLKERPVDVLSTIVRAGGVRDAALLALADRLVGSEYDTHDRSLDSLTSRARDEIGPFETSRYPEHELEHMLVVRAGGVKYEVDTIGRVVACYRGDK